MLRLAFDKPGRELSLRQLSKAIGFVVLCDSECVETARGDLQDLLRELVCDLDRDM